MNVRKAYQSLSNRVNRAGRSGLTSGPPTDNLVAMANRNSKGQRARLLEILLHRSLRFGRFRLASGGESDFYVDVRKTSLDPEGASLIAHLLVEATRLGEPGGPTAVGGPTLGADPLVAALGLEAHTRGRRVDCFLVRKDAKDHGTEGRVEGNLPSGADVLLVDDVLTQGSSLASSVPAVLQAGARVAAFACVVDREAGGRERLTEFDVPFHALFRLSELLKAAGRSVSKTA
jgi:orotate phosphoribosyltransferase